MRLLTMNRVVVRSAVAAAVVLASLATPWSDKTASAQSGEQVTMNVSVGVEGYVDPTRPTSATVEITSQNLLVGSVRASLGGRSFSASIEVPANSTKVYSIAVGRPGNSRRLNVSVVPEGSSEAVLTQQFDLRIPDAALVGLIDLPNATPALNEATTAPFAKEIVPLELQNSVFDANFDVLPYLAVGPGSIVAMSPEHREALVGWVNGGGRLIAESSDLIALGVALTPSSELSGVGQIAAAGAGELVVVDPTGLTRETWSRAIRDVPLPVENTFIDESGFELVSAAASTSSTIPELPWLFGVLFLYVLIAGPANFFVLNRLGRRDLAWVTIPVISLVAVLGIWLFGRGQVESQRVAHASVITQEEGSVLAVSGLVVLAGTPGEHELVTGPELSVTSTAFGFDGSSVETQTTAEGGTRVVMDLPSLAAAPFEGRWNIEPLALDIVATPEGAGFDLAVVNNSDAEFWAWGAASGGSVVLHPDVLPTGAQQQLSLRNPRPLQPWQQPLQEVTDRLAVRRGSDQDVWQVLWPLTNTATNIARTTLTTRPFLFAFTDDLGPEVRLDGGSVSATGPSLLIIPLPGRTGSIVDVLEVAGADFVDRGPGFLYASNPEQVNLRFLTEPVGNTFRIEVQEFAFQPGQNQPVYNVYNWETSEFASFDEGDAIGRSFVSPGGEVMVGIAFEGQSDLELGTGQFQLVWEASG